MSNKKGDSVLNQEQKGVKSFFSFFFFFGGEMGMRVLQHL